MIPYNMQGLTLFQIEIFLRCAEYVNFAKAAQELSISPSVVSKKISAMETALGYALFEREKNKVSLTSEGEALYAAWRQPVKTMVRQAEQIKGRGSSRKALSFSLCEFTNLERFFVPLISAYSSEQDLVFQIRMYQEFSGMDEVLSGKVDIAFVPKFAERGIRQSKELDCFLALPSALYAAMSSSHLLAQKKLLQVEDLRDTDLLVPEKPLELYMDMLYELCAGHGFAAKTKAVDSGKFKTVYLGMDDKGILVTDKSYHAFSSNAVEYREIEGTEGGLLMVYRKNAPSRVRQFVEFARTFYKELR